MYSLCAHAESPTYVHCVHLVQYAVSYSIVENDRQGILVIAKYVLSVFTFSFNYIQRYSFVMYCASVHIYSTINVQFIVI